MLSENRKSLWIIFLILTLLLVISVQGLPVVLAQEVVKLDRDDPSMVTYYTHDGDVSVERDPQLAGSVTSVRWVDNSFLPSCPSSRWRWGWPRPSPG